MRRIVIWLASTVTIVVLLFGYHTSTNKTSSPGILNDTSTPTTMSGKQSSSSANNRSSGSASSPAKITTYTGSVAQTRWGPVQVKITVQAGKLTKVTIMQHPSGNSRDAVINSQALPILIDETVQAQSANIDMVSGATVTSEGYLQSLQAALDQAGSDQRTIEAVPTPNRGTATQPYVANPPHRHSESDDDD